MTTNTFYKFARSKGVNSMALHQYQNAIDQRRPKMQGMQSPMVVEHSSLNASTISVFDRLMMDRIIFLGEEIDDVVANIINAQLLFLSSDEDEKKEPIWMYINSPGGDCYSGLAVYDTGRMISSPLYTFVMGLAASMAFIIAISGEEGHRYALPHSRLLLHQPWSNSGGGQATDIEIANIEMQELKTDLIGIVAEHTKNDKKKVRRDAERDMWFTAKRAVEYGAIDKIITKL